MTITLNKIILIIGAVLSLLVLSLLTWFFWPDRTEQPSSNEQTPDTYVERYPYQEESLYLELISQLDPLEQIEGYLFITSGLKEKPSTGSWAYDLLNDSFDYVSLNATQIHQHLYRAQASGDYIYKGTKTVQSDGQWHNPEMRINDENGDRKLQILDDSLLRDHLYTFSVPRLSPDGQYYTYSLKLWPKDQPEPPTEEISSWGTYIGKVEGNQPSVYLTSGYDAKWTPDGTGIVYVKDEGIFIRPFSGDFEEDIDAEETLLVNDLMSYRPHNQFSLSSDGQYLVVTQPIGPSYGNPHVDLYKLTLGDSPVPSAQMVQRIIIDDNGGAYWPLFSPGGRYISMQTRHLLPEGGEDNHIRFYDLLNSSFVDEIDFNDADFDIAFNTGWVKEFEISDLSD